jgi:hypothetical protein
MSTLPESNFRDADYDDDSHEIENIQLDDDTVTGKI